MTADAGEQPPAIRTTGVSGISRVIRDLHPSYFAFVMATGIISTGTFLLGPSWLSLVLLAAGCAGLAVLGVALAVRLVRFHASVTADIQAPDRVFGFFTISAGLDVLGVRFAFGGHPVVAAILVAFGAAFWLLLTYGIPAALLTRTSGSVLECVNGSWLLWIVATQSVSLASAILVLTWPSQSSLLAPVAAGLWCVGLVLYLMVVTLILMHWLTGPMTPATFGPPYWILMGATAISVLAGARLLTLPPDTPVIKATGGFVEGSTFALWAFGTWWIPLLLILSLWRHTRRHWPLTYEPTMWSVVFPLGMYSVATLTFGKDAHLGFMEPIARVMIWIAVAAWVLVGAGFTSRFIHRRDKLVPEAPASASGVPSG